MNIERDPSPAEIERAFEKVGPIVLGRPLDVSLTTTSQKVAHGLGRVPVGWLPMSQKSGAVPYESQDPDEKHLYLVATAALTTKVWVW